MGDQKCRDLSFLTYPGIDQCRDVDYCTLERVDARSTTVGRMRGRELCDSYELNHGILMRRAAPPPNLHFPFTG